MGQGHSPPTYSALPYPAFTIRCPTIGSSPMSPEKSSAPPDRGSNWQPSEPKHTALPPSIPLRRAITTTPSAFSELGTQQGLRSLLTQTPVLTNKKCQSGLSQGYMGKDPREGGWRPVGPPPLPTPTRPVQSLLWEPYSPEVPARGRPGPYSSGPGQTLKTG